jgi:hypothetical protein
MPVLWKSWKNHKATQGWYVGDPAPHTEWCWTARLVISTKEIRSWTRTGLRLKVWNHTRKSAAISRAQS